MFESCGFKSWRRILDGRFFSLICCKNCIVCLKRPNINEKVAGVGSFFLKKHSSLKDIYLCLHSKWPTIMEFFKCLEEKKCYHTKSMDGVNLLFVWVQWPQVVSWHSEMACIEMAFSASVFVLTISGPHIICRIIKVGNFISLVRSVQYS